MFRTGTLSEPPATSITVTFVDTPTDSADPRPGMNPKWHRLITVNASVRVFFQDGGFEFAGPLRFFVVRGDSAQIPADLLAAGVRPASARWWLVRWDDETFKAYSAEPAIDGPKAINSGSWGRLKSLYR
jgi:hypothetical protein